MTDLKYSLSPEKDFYEVSGIENGTDGEIVIPSVYKGLPVKSVGMAAFYGDENVRSVFILDSVHTIGPMAFCGCTSLSRITLNLDAMEEIGNGAFKDCPNVETINGETGFKCSGVSVVGRYDCPDVEYRGADKDSADKKWVSEISVIEKTKAGKRMRCDLLFQLFPCSDYTECVSTRS